MRQLFRPQVYYIVLIILVALISLSSHPAIVEISRSSGLQSGTILSRYIILVFGALFVMCFNWNSMFRSKLVRESWGIFLFIIIAYILTYGIFNTKEMMNDLRSIAICIVAIMIGWQTCLDERRQRILLLSYAILTAYIGLMQVLVNVGGFVILDQYATDNKNSIGVMLATSSFVFLMQGINSEKYSKGKWLLIVGAIFTFILLLTIRARGATLTLVLLLLYVFYERYKGNNFILYLFGGVIVLSLIVICLPSGAKEYVVDSIFQGREGDLTTGRSERNKSALIILSEHPFLGNLVVRQNVEWVHNYPLLKLQNFGLIFAFPIVLLYLILLIKAIIMTIRSDNRNIFNLGYYLLLIPFIISMSEPTFPFGPGTATVFNFILFGVALRNSSDVGLKS